MMFEESWRRNDDLSEEDAIRLAREAVRSGRVVFLVVS